MPIDAALLQRIPKAARAAVQALADKQDDLKAENKLLLLKVQLLEERLRLARIAKFGPKSEKLSDQQLALLTQEPALSEEEVEGEAALPQPEKRPLRVSQPRRYHPGREELPAHLERRVEVVACPPEQLRCDRERTLIGMESTEVLELEPAKYYVRVIQREKRICRTCSGQAPVTAPTAIRIIEKGKIGDGLAVDMVLKKFVEHLPVYRQCETLDREAGIELSRMTVCGVMMEIGSRLMAVCRAQQEDLVAGDYLQADETSIGVQSPETRGRNHAGYLWQYSRPRGPIIFDFQMSRARAGPKAFLKNFCGILQTDGYAAYDQIGAKGMIHAACMTHARRKFADALKLYPDDLRAAAIIDQFAKLYAIEEQMREARFDFAQRLTLRQEKSRPLMLALRERIVATRQQMPPASALSKACDYTLGLWPRLSVFLDHGQVEIDSNLAENSMRPIALGRKNWLHFGSEDAGPKIAAILSIIETCHRLSINPRDYLLDTLPKIPSWPAKRVAELTPTAWKYHSPCSPFSIVT